MPDRIAVLLAVVTIVSASAVRAEDADEVKTDGLVNLARLGITRVWASSVNGKRPQDNPFYGVRNMFDGGKNVINHTNYDYWQSAPGELHTIRIRFERPVTVKTLIVDIREPKGTKEILFASLDRRLRPLGFQGKTPVTGKRWAVMRPKPQDNVSFLYVMIWSAERDTPVSVSEIGVYGPAPKGVDLTPVKPGIIKPLKGDHQMKVRRNAKTDVEKRMIALAEAAYPPREDVVKAFKAAHSRPEDVPADELLWWCGGTNATRIPYAITAEAVDYYVARTEELRKREWQQDFRPSSHFKYSADVSLEPHFKTDGKTFEDVYVVRMKLSFSYLYGNLGGIAFSKERIVVIDRAGTVLFISGDGRPPILMS